MQFLYKNPSISRPVAFVIVDNNRKYKCWKLNAHLILLWCNYFEWCVYFDLLQGL